MDHELSSSLSALAEHIQRKHVNDIVSVRIHKLELTVDVHPASLLTLCRSLRNDTCFAFDMLLDVCGVDYLHFGLDEWQTQSATSTGFSRGFQTTLDEISKKSDQHSEGRFGVVYHLLSLTHNTRLRLKVNLSGTHPQIDSVVSIWPSANWFEREAFDLFGITFQGHPDLRRLLTDYGFIGYPFRKDFPLSGEVEVRYDAAQKRVLYEPIQIEPRVLEPKVIRRDNRYEEAEGESS